MGWLVLEALVAAGLLVFMVWWTMGSGRRREAPSGEDAPPDGLPDAPPDGPPGPRSKAP